MSSYRWSAISVQYVLSQKFAYSSYRKIERDKNVLFKNARYHANIDLVTLLQLTQTLTGYFRGLRSPISETNDVKKCGRCSLKLRICKYANFIGAFRIPPFMEVSATDD